MMKYILSLFLIGSAALTALANDNQFFKADHPFIQYTGRVDDSNPLKPKFWASGAYVEIKFKGSYCAMKINDEMLWGNVLNYLEIKIDDQPAYRIRLKGKENEVMLFSPYLVHGGGYNFNADVTRISLEIRFWKI